MQSPRGKRESEWASARECAQNREFSRIDWSRVGAKTSKGTWMSNENVAHKSITFLIQSSGKLCHQNGTTILEFDMEHRNALATLD